MFVELSVCPKASVLLSVSVSHMLTCSIFPAHPCLKTRFVLPDGGYNGPFLQEASSLIELAACRLWVPGLSWQPPRVCNGEQVFRLKACLLNEFGDVDTRERDFPLGSPASPPAPLVDLGCAWLQRGDPLSCIHLFRGGDEWLPLSSYFLLVNFHSVLWPVPVITFHTCLTPFLL